MSDTNPRDSITALWVRDVQHLWQVQENLLNNYRTYLIVLNSLLAAGSCTIMVRLSYLIADDPLNAPPVKFFLIVILISLLALFTAFAFGSIILMGKVISNRGYNVHLCQYVIIKLQLGKFFQEALPNLGVEDLEKISLLSAFKTVEHPKKHKKGFVCIDDNHALLRDFLWSIKASRCKAKFDRFDYSRRNIHLLLKSMFILIWIGVSFFCLLVAGWLICRSSGTFYLSHPCPCRLLV